MSKVCVIGLDGGTFSVISYLIGQSRLPNFERIMAKGSSATLLSTIPPLTPAAWSSFYTGSNPGKTGAVGFFRFRPGTYQLEPMNATNLEGEPIWSIASARGKRVCVYNVPVTYPARPVNGVLISGMDAPHFDEYAIYPAGMRDDFLAAVPDFKISNDVDAKYMLSHYKDPVAQCIQQLEAHLGMEIRVMNHLMQMEDWDLFVGVLRSTDSFQHIFWRDVEKKIRGDVLSAAEDSRAEAVFSCYEAIDREVGDRWLDWCSDRDIIFMSDHGFGELRSDVCLNRVLAEAGLLAFLPRPKGGGPGDYVKKFARTHLSADNRKKIKRLLGKDESGQRWNVFVDSLVADIDWSRTKIFGVAQHGCLYVNLKGRDPMGIVEESDRLAVLEEAERALMQLKDPQDGEPVVTGFYRKEDIYSGPLMDSMPDMVINMRGWSYRGISSTAIELAREEIFRPQAQEWGELGHSGTHRREGIMIMQGPNIMPGRLPEAEMVDIAPTILALLGLPAGQEMDGKVLNDALTNLPVTQPAGEQEPEQSAPEPEHTYSTEDEQEIRKRLENLGYL